MLVGIQQDELKCDIGSKRQSLLTSQRECSTQPLTLDSLHLPHIPSLWDVLPLPHSPSLWMPCFSGLLTCLLRQGGYKEGLQKSEEKGLLWDLSYRRNPLPPAKKKKKESAEGLLAVEIQSSSRGYSGHN